LPPFELAIGRPRRLFGEDLHEAARHVHLPLDRVEDEELGLGTEIGGVAEAGALEVGLGLLRDGARVALVSLARRGLEHVAGQDQRGLVVERVHVRGIRIRHQQHVGCLDALPARDRRAVEGMPILELALVERLRRDGHVLFLALCIGKAQVDELDLVFLDCLEHVAAAMPLISPDGGCALKWGTSGCEPVEAMR
jgi:hypothetical protein